MTLSNVRRAEQISTKVNSVPYPSLEVFIEGMGTHSTPGGSPIYLEYYEGGWRLHVWSDITQEDTTHVIDLSGAAEGKS